jgi:hypothetical protein
LNERSPRRLGWRPLRDAPDKSPQRTSGLRIEA